MKRKLTNLRTRLYLVAALTLIIGLGSAVLIYLTADNDSVGALGYEVVGGNVYPIAPEDSKKYIHDLELYGGKASVLADELIRWFEGLWHGKSLAYTIACITVVISSAFFFVASRLPSGLRTDVPDENNRIESR